jgi:hypothetical protein
MLTFQVTRNALPFWSGTAYDLLYAAPFSGQLTIMAMIEDIEAAIGLNPMDYWKDAQNVGACRDTYIVVAVDPRELEAGLDAAAFASPGTPEQWPVIAELLRRGVCPDTFPIHVWVAAAPRYKHNLAAR